MRKGTHSTGTLLALASDAQNTVEIPATVQLTPEEAAFWPIFASARTRADWRPMDLVLLGTVCQLEVSMRKDRKLLAETGSVIRNPNGNRIPNPLIQIIQTKQNQQLSILRALGMTSKPDSRVVAGRAERARTFTQAPGDDDALFAKPH